MLDPVGVGATSFRRETGAALLARGPAIVRGNASEIAALAGLGSAGKGVDSTLATEAALEAARDLARNSGAVVAATGPVDLVTDGERVRRVANGHPLLARTTASGCALSALVGAWVAVVADPLDATTGALAAYGCAAELAARKAQGPGSFVPALLDALATLEAATFDQMARVE